MSIAQEQTNKSKKLNWKFHIDDSLNKTKEYLVFLCGCAWKVGKEDPRRAIHALKVGVALTIVSLLYLVEPLFERVGKNSMWAVMTVVVVLEFTAGATLCKGLNRGFGTICAVSLAFLVAVIAENCGRVLHASIIATSVFVIGFIATYMRFIPYIKKNYDYGVLIFLLTFNLITISSYRVPKVFDLARDRICTIAIGCAICLLMSLLIVPNWSGEDLHNSTIYKLEALARSIEGCVNEYFKDQDMHETISKEDLPTDRIYNGYRAVLDSKTSDETLALFASWEPRHSRHCYRQPWEQYVKLGDILRYFGYTAVALHGCLESEIQTPQSVRSLFQGPCIRVAAEVCKVLNELAANIRSHCHSPPSILSNNLHEALHDLNSAIKKQPRLFLGANKKTRIDVNMFQDSRLNKNASSAVSLTTFKSDTISVMEWRNKNVAESRKSYERKMLRPTLSKLAIASLEFSEALPFAAFASLLVEMVARLELVIEEVEELSRAAHFKDIYQQDEIKIVMKCEDTRLENDAVSSAAE